MNMAKLLPIIFTAFHSASCSMTVEAAAHANGGFSANKMQEDNRKWFATQEREYAGVYV